MFLSQRLFFVSGYAGGCPGWWCPGSGQFCSCFEEKTYGLPPGTQCPQRKQSSPALFSRHLYYKSTPPPPPPPQHTHILLTAIFSFCLLSVIRLQLDPFSSDCAEIFRSAYVHASSCCPEKICLDLLSPT